jgi:hypothetical protein
MIKRTDFKQVIAEIRSAGITHYKLGLMMHRQISWVDRIAKGQEPKHYEGEMLLMIRDEYAPRETFKNEPSRLHNPLTEE